MFRVRNQTAVVGLLAMSILACRTGRAAAEAPKPNAPPSLFREVIPAPTGKNGYEELILAADALESSAQYRKAEQLAGENNLTLAMERYVLLDPPVVRALAMLKRGLAKPVSAPRPAGAAATVPPELSHFRRLARLLAMQQYVLLADGRVAEAIGNARLGLQLGQAVKTDSLLTGLVGVAISAVCIHSLAAHLDQLSARDCEMLYEVCQEWLRQPDPALRILEGERLVMKRSLAEQLAAGKEPGVDAILVPAQKQFDAMVDRLRDELKKPAWERSHVTLPDDGSVGARLVALVLPALERAGDSCTSEEARIRLLAGHAAVLRYRWEHEALPANLAVLNLGELAVDPFTGQPLRYELRGTREYRLSSAGPTAATDDPKAVNGRRPISVVPGEP